MKKVIKKGKPIEDLEELNLKMAEKMAEMEVGEIDGAELKAYAASGMVMVNSCKAMASRDEALGVKREIRFLDGNRKLLEIGQKPSNLIDEFIKK